MKHPARRILKYTMLAIGAALVALFTAIGVISVFRQSPPAMVAAVGDPEGTPEPGDPEFSYTMALLTGSALASGNNAEILLNGDETFPALWRDLRAARSSITMQLYYVGPGTLADSMVHIVSERARAGVRVYVLLDDFGSVLPDSSVAQMRQAGVHVAMFRPVKWYTIHKAQNRSHVRAVTIDGTIGYTGGFGIDDKWLGDGRSEPGWRETNVRFTGPVVSELQAAFVRGWVEATGRMLVGDVYFPRQAPMDATGPGMRAGIMLSTPVFGPSTSARFLALSVAGARRTVHITNAYFIPDATLLRLLRDAAGRGVDVRLLLPNEKTDVPMTRHAARSFYAELLAAGVKIFEYNPTMIHAKTFVVDGVWSSIGSMNLDNRSLAVNDEANLMVLDSTFGLRMDSVFTRDLQRSSEIRLDAFQRRGAWEKLRERFTRIGRRLL